MAEKPAVRLRKARKEAGYPSAAAFANANESQGLTESAYRHKENGTREITLADAKLFARLLVKKLPWITWEYIADGAANSQNNMAQVIGYAGAGEQIFPFDNENVWDPLPAPPGMASAVAAVVKGTSNFPVYRDGDVLFFPDQPAPINSLLGKDCLVQVVNGPRLIKNLRKGSKRGHYKLYSYATDTESEDVRLEWAAPVQWIERR